jgi:hypothetical protein
LLLTIQVSPGPVHFLQDAAHDTLAFAPGVDLGVVEEVHSVVVGELHQGLGNVVRDELAEGEPGAERQLGNLETGASKAAIAHLHVVKIGPWTPPPHLRGMSGDLLLQGAGAVGHYPHARRVGGLLF